MRKLIFFLLFATFKLAHSSEIPAAFIPNSGQFNYHLPTENDILYYFSAGDIQVLFKKNSLSYIIKSRDNKNLKYYNSVADTNEAIGHNLFLKDSAYYYRMDIVFKNANPQAQITNSKKANHYYNYYLGSDIRTTLVYPSSEIIYKSIYPGIDIKFYAKNNGIKYDFIVHPGGNVQNIQLEYIGANLSIENDQILIETPIKSWYENIPKSYILETNDNINATYLQTRNIISFQTPAYNKENTLIIDPELTWSTYYNAKQDFNYIYQSLDAYKNDIILATRVDATFIPYLIAGTGAYFDNAIGGSNDFLLLKFNNQGQITWATYFGSSGSETFKGGIKFDKTGRIYFLSANSNNDMPTQTLAGAYHGARSTSGTSFDDIHIARFSNSGTFEWGTWIPCDYYHEAADIAIAPDNSVYIAGHFGSSYKFGSAFPLVNPGGNAYYKNTRYLFPATFSSQFNNESFIIQFNATGSLVWSTYFGAEGNENIRKIHIAANGTIFLAGSASPEYKRPTGSTAYQYYSPLLKTANAFYDNDHQNGKSKLYIVKFNTDRSHAWSTLFGNKNGTSQAYNQSYGIVNLLSDSQNNIYIVDGTTDNSMPILTPTGAYTQSGPSSTNTATKLYIAKFSNATSHLWSTYFSDITNAEGYWRIGAYMDADDELYVVAGTPNLSHPILSSSPGYNKATREGYKDGILARFNKSNALIWSTYFGGENGDDEVKQVVVTGTRDCSDKDIIITGRTGGTGSFAGANSWPVINPGGSAHIENYPGSSYYQIGIARFSESKLPQNLANDNDSKTCPCSGSSYTHFIPSGSDRIIASINPNGQNLGNTTVNAYVNAAAFQLADCNNSSASFNVAAMNRRFKITPTTQPTSNVNVRFYYSTIEFSTLRGASQINTNPNDNISTTTAFGELKATRFSASSGNAAFENGNFPDNCGKGTFNLHSNSGTGTAASLFSGFDANGRYVEFSVPGFSEFWLHGKIDESPLPVELLTFSAACQENQIRINWSTVSEQNNAYFQIEKSIDGENWSFVKRVSGAGNSNSFLNYEIIDEQPYYVNSLYRLSQIDYDGTTTYFAPYSIECKANNSSISIFPNPANQNPTLFITTTKSAIDAMLLITDVSGKIITQKTIQLEIGNNSLQIDASNWPSGMYFAQVIHTNLKLEAQKLIISK